MKTIGKIPALLVVSVLVGGGCSDSGGGESTIVTTESAPTTILPGRYAQQVFSSTTVTKDVVYATAPDLQRGAMLPLTLDLFEPVGDESRDRPAIVWVHGGGFYQGSKRDITSVAEGGGVEV